jgi:hypothetical protein
MQATMIDLTAAFSDHSQCDLRIICGPRYNAFVPAADRREEPAKFFQISTWKAMAKALVREEDTEYWDGLE